MQAKKVIAFEYKKEDRLYSLIMPDGAPLGEAYEAAASFLGEMVRLINEHKEKQQPQPEDEAEASKESQEA